MRELRAEFQALQDENKALKSAATAKPEDEAAETETPEVDAKYQALSDKYDAMAKDFAEFKKKPAAEHTETATGDEDPPVKERAYHKTGINQRTVYRNDEK